MARVAAILSSIFIKVDLLALLEGKEPLTGYMLFGPLGIDTKILGSYFCKTFPSPFLSRGFFGESFIILNSLAVMILIFFRSIF